MFNNLIESSSHTREFKRRGSFVLFTAATYFLLFVIGGVISIYAYDARLEDPNTEIIVMLPPVDLAMPRPVVAVPNPRPPRGKTSQNLAVRENPTASVNVPQAVPLTPSANPNPTLPVPDTGLWTRGGQDSDPGQSIGPRGSGDDGGPETGRGATPVVEVGTPPIPVVERPKPKIVYKNVINSQAVSLPKPPYPPLAKQLGIQGSVSVQVLIDESGKVVSAKTISGSAMLAVAARQAAYGARFSPTILGEQPVKVSGVITYNFVLER